MTTDATWTLFVRVWRSVARGHRKKWLQSPERLRGLIVCHPLPWVIDQDWTWEVIASDGACVGKFQLFDEAERFIALAAETRDAA